MPQLTRCENVFTLNLGDNENIFTSEWIDSMLSSLDVVEATEGPAALVTAATGKYWSNGLDLQWIASNMDSLDSYIESVHTLLARFLTASVPTIAAIQGHCFAAGAIFALAHDFRIMRADRGFFCLPEVDLAITFNEGMSSLIKSKATPQVAHRAMTTGHRYGGSEALESELVDAAVAESEVLSRALEDALALAGKSSRTLGEIKRVMYQSTLDLLTGNHA